MSRRRLKVLLGWSLVFCAAGLASCQPDFNDSSTYYDEYGELPPPDDPGPGTANPPPPLNETDEVRINEVMVSNQATLADESGAYPPWIEIYNAAEEPADLSGISLSDDPQEPEKWVFPAGPASVVPARGYLVVFCDGSPPGTPGLHTPFTLKSGPLDLVFDNGSDLFLADGSALGTDQTAGRTPDGEDRIALLENPTPGAANAPAAAAGGPLRGDINQDGLLDISDATGLLGYLFLSGAISACQAVADFNVDGAVDISDPLGILTFLFLGGQSPPPLSPEDLRRCGPNNPPVLAARPVYHTYPGFAAEFRIDATDPEEDRLVYQGIDLPPGASLEPSTGVLRWTPAADQLGPFYFTFSVSDEAFPPNRVGGRIVFQVHPLDGCTRPVCDPATGCQPALASLTEACCGSRPPRVPEPDVGCPAGGVLYVGRNPVGSATIGRLENCDQFRFIPLGQGGYTARLNFEARCLNPKGIRVEVRLNDLQGLLFDDFAVVDFEQQADGFVQRLGLRIQIEVPFTEGEPALLTVAATDSTGLRLERKVRITLTGFALPDLP